MLNNFYIIIYISFLYVFQHNSYLKKYKKKDIKKKYFLSICQAITKLTQKKCFAIKKKRVS